MTIDLNIPLVQALQTRLQNDMPTFINQVNAQFTNPDFPVDQIQNVFDFVPSIKYLSAFPAIGIAEGDITVQDDTGWAFDANTTFSVVVFEQRSEQRELSWALRKLSVAVTRCIMQGRSLPPDGWSLQLRRVRPGPTLGRDENPRQWMSTTTVQVDVRSTQDA